MDSVTTKMYRILSKPDPDRERVSWYMIKAFLRLDYMEIKRAGAVDAFIASSHEPEIPPGRYLYLVTDVEASDMDSEEATLVLADRPDYVDYVAVDNRFMVLRYDLSEFKDDIALILKGEYSQLSSKAKEIMLVGIPEYANKYVNGESVKLRARVWSILNPKDEDRERIGKELGVDPSLIKETYKIPDIEYETLNMVEIGGQ